ncbi:MAG: preprotein translocase subunit TatA [Nostocoides sp.]
MTIFGINGWELLILGFLAVALLGPDRMPEYAAKMAHGIRRVRVMAENAKVQLKEQLGPEYEDLNWRQYDPRQYDPRRIVREALQEPLDTTTAAIKDAGAVIDGTTIADPAPAQPVAIAATDYDPSRPTPWDVDAT